MVTKAASSRFSDSYMFTWLFLVATEVDHLYVFNYSPAPAPYNSEAILILVPLADYCVSQDDTVESRFCLRLNDEVLFPFFKEAPGDVASNATASRCVPKLYNDQTQVRNCAFIEKKITHTSGARRTFFHSYSMPLLPVMLTFLVMQLQNWFDCQKHCWIKPSEDAFATQERAKLILNAPYLDHVFWEWLPNDLAHRFVFWLIPYDCCCSGTKFGGVFPQSTTVCHLAYWTCSRKSY